MHANKVSDFYDNSDKKVKKKLFKVYKADQLTQKRKKQIYNIYEAVKDLETVKIFIKNILKNEYIIKERENAHGNRVDFSYKEGILEDCLERLGETKFYTFLLFVYGVICKIKQYPKQNQTFFMNIFVDILFTSMHSYNRGILTSNKFIERMEDCFKVV
ncbi:DUF643 domain-containing protein (plasmid) [Borreliella japonica]|uniref:DUF643 domain-containing protein n=1 Tax=Borreliella japonica TaxID=34095 RepID=UPI003AB82EA7